jgi:hypothetical protein
MSPPRVPGTKPDYRRPKTRGRPRRPPRYRLPHRAAVNADPRRVSRLPQPGTPVGHDPAAHRAVPVRRLRQSQTCALVLELQGPRARLRVPNASGRTPTVRPCCLNPPTNTDCQAMRTLRSPRTARWCTDCSAVSSRRRRTSGLTRWQAVRSALMSRGSNTRGCRCTTTSTWHFNWSSDSRFTLRNSNFLRMLAAQSPRQVRPATSPSGENQDAYMGASETSSVRIIRERPWSVRRELRGSVSRFRQRAGDVR